MAKTLNLKLFHNHFSYSQDLFIFFNEFIEIHIDVIVQRITFFLFPQGHVSLFHWQWFYILLQ